MDQASPKIPRKLLPLLQKRKRFKIVIGGRGSGKSTTIADICVQDAATGMKIGCFREFQNSIEDSVHSLLTEEIDRLSVPGFSITDKEISSYAGGTFKFRGLARNADSIKSMHGFDRFWIEEAQAISARSLKLLIPTLREGDSEIWMSANPMSRVDPFSARFIEPFTRELERNGYYEDDLHLIIVCNYYDNPFFPTVLDQDRKYDKSHLSTAEYEHIWLGKYNDSIDNAIVPADWFDAAVDAHLKLGIAPAGARYVAHDPSDTGPDPKGLSMRHGPVVLHAAEMLTGDANEGCDWAIEYARAQNVDHFTWDCDGLGVSLARQVKLGFSNTSTQWHMYKGSEGVDNPDEPYQAEGTDYRTNKQTFRNKRAQYYWALRDRFENTYAAVIKGQYTDPESIISISSDIECIDQLRSEVCRIPKKPNANGLIQIMTKEEMLSKYKIQSPNLADALMMTMYTEPEQPYINLAANSRHYHGQGNWMR